MDIARAFDSAELRRVFGTFVTGVTVVSTVGRDGARFGVTANSFSSVSLEPPLVLWSQARTSPSHRAFFEAPVFAVNILAEDQVHLSRRFATSGGDKFANLEIDEGLSGLPLLRGCSAWLECEVVSKIPGGDHTIYIGEVKRLRRGPRKSLAFGNGQYLVTDIHACRL